MVDLRAMSDDETIALIELARGFDRELLVMALAYTHGDAGVPFLRAALNQRGPGSVHLRTSAMGALVTRLGAEAVPDLVPMFAGGGLEIQLAAVMFVEDVDDGRNVDAVLGWLGRRLRAEKRANTWGLYEVSGALRYAIRVGALPQVLRTLEEEKERLQPEERELLDRVWPPTRRARYLEAGEPADGPDASTVEDWYRTSVGVWGDEERLAVLAEDIGPVVEKLRKRRERAAQGPV